MKHQRSYQRAKTAAARLLLVKIFTLRVPLFLFLFSLMIGNLWVVAAPPSFAQEGEVGADTPDTDANTSPASLLPQVEGALYTVPADSNRLYVPSLSAPASAAVSPEEAALPEEVGEPIPDGLALGWTAIALTAQEWRPPSGVVTETEQVESAAFESVPAFPGILTRPEGEPVAAHPPVTNTEYAFGTRSAVPNVEVFPWSAIVRVHIYYNEVPGSYFVCSGALINAAHVLTAGDCLYDRDDYGWADSVRVVPAYTNGDMPFGEATARQADLRVFSQYRSGGDLYYNIGLVRLNRPVGYLTGHLGYGYNTDSFIEGATFQNPAYPRVSPFNLDRMANWSGTFTIVNTDGLGHNRADDGGSGSAAFTTVGTSGQVIYGVDAFLLDGNNGYARLTSTKYNQIDDWVESDIPTSVDLVPLDVNISPTRIVAGSAPTRSSFVHYNYSKANWTSSYTVDYYLSTNDTLSVSSDTFLGRYTYTGDIRAGRAVEAYVSNAPTIPPNTPGGTYWIGVRVNATDSNTGNNITQGWDMQQVRIDPIPPRMEVNEATRYFAMTFGGGLPPSPSQQSIFVGGVGAFTWSATKDANWIVLNRTSGSRGDSIAVSINPTGLTPRPYNGTVTITGPTADGQPAVIPIRFDYELARLEVGPSAIDLQATFGGPPVTTSLTANVYGRGTFPWTVSSGASWLTVEPTHATNLDTVSVILNPSGLTAGRYYADLTVDAGEAISSPWTVPVSFTVGAGDANLLIEPTALSFSAMAGGANPSPQAIAIRSANGFAFPWRAETDAAWLPGREGAGTAPGVFDVAPEISGLSPGVYETTVIINTPADPRPEAARQVAVSLTIEPSAPEVPVLQLSPATLRFSAVKGAGNPPAQRFQIRNAGGGDLNWTIQEELAWVTVDRQSGQGDFAPTVTVEFGNLSAGFHAGALTIVDGSGKSQRINVMLTLDLPPTLAVDNTRLVYSALTGTGNPPNRSFTVRNAGSGTFNWNAREEIPWLTLSPSSGAAPAEVAASASIEGLQIGLYQGNIEIHSEMTVGSPATVNASLHLRRGPALDLFPATLYPNVIAGSNGANVAQIDVLNVGQGMLNWTIEENIPWLSVSHLQGTTPSLGRTTLNVGIDARDLASSDTAYTGQITLRSNNGEGSPRTIHVSLIVASQAAYCRIPVGGSAHLLYTNALKLTVQNVQRQLTADGGCDLSARLKIDMPQNENVQVDIVGHVSQENKFTSTPANRQANLFAQAYSAADTQLRFKVASGVLILDANYTIDDEKGITSRARYQLPSPLVTAERINSRLPVQVKGDAEIVELDAEVNIGPSGIRGSGSATIGLPDLCWKIICLYENTIKTEISPDFNYVVEVKSRRGVVQLPEGGNGTIANTTLRFQSKAHMLTGSIEQFDVPSLAGLRLSASHLVVTATEKEQEITLASAHLFAPQEWIEEQESVTLARGEGQVAIYGVRIDVDKIVASQGKPSAGDITIASGSFSIPPLEANGFRLYSLKGELKPLPNKEGYQLEADGLFAMISAYRDCPVAVDVTVTARNIAFQSVEAAAPQATKPEVQLDNLTIDAQGCDPGIPLDDGMFFITDLHGEIVLTPKTNTVDVDAYIQTSRHAIKMPILGWQPWVAADPELSIRVAPSRDDFERVEFQSRVYLGGIAFLNVEAEILPTYARLELTGRETLIAYGLTVESNDYKSSDRSLDITGWGELVINKGLIARPCIRVPSPTIRNPGRMRDVCASIPPHDITLARREIGGGIDNNGVYLQDNSEYAGFSYGWRFYFHPAPKVNVYAGTPFAMAVSSAQVENLQRGEAAAFELGPTQPISFTPEGAVVIDLPVAPVMPPDMDLYASTTISTFENELRRDIAFALIQPITGTRTLSVIDPTGRHYTMDNLPSHMHYIFTTGVTETQTLLTVNQAVAGTWKAQLDGESKPYYLVFNANTPAPEFRNPVTITDMGNNQARVQWRLLAPTAPVTLRVYANDNPQVTRTETITNADGSTSAMAVHNFDGVQVAEVVTSTVNGTLQSVVLDLATLPSGNYWFWIELDDGNFVPARTALQKDGQVAHLQVNNSSTFPTQWDSATEASFAMQDSEMTIRWNAHTHPDIQRYIVRVETVDPIVPTDAVERRVGVGTGASEGKLQTLLDNIAPGLPYTVSIGLENRTNGAIVWSNAKRFHAPQPDFGITVNDTNLQLHAGGAMVNIPLTVQLSSDLLEPVAVEVDVKRLPVGLEVTLDSQVASVAAVGSGPVAQVAASATLPPGNYTIPLIARSGMLVHTLDVKLEVLPPSASGTNAVFLPSVMR